MLFKRQMRTTLPSIADTNAVPTRKRKLARGDLPGHDLPELSPGDVVRYRKNKTWGRMGKVIGKSSQPRSYKIETDKGTIIRRNRRHLLLTKEKFHLDNDTISLCSIDDCDLLLDDNRDVEVNDESVNQAVQREAIVITTRSGRTSRQPRHLNDYVL